MTWLRREPVPLTLVLEPLLFGVLPQSVLPVVLVMPVAIGVALALLPYHVLRYHDHILVDDWYQARIMITPLESAAANYDNILFTTKSSFL